MTERLTRTVGLIAFALLVWALSPAGVAAQASQTPDDAEYRAARKEYEEALKAHREAEEAFEAAAEEVSEADHDYIQYPDQGNADRLAEAESKYQIAKDKRKNARDRFEEAERRLALASNDKEKLNNLVRQHEAAAKRNREAANAYRQKAQSEQAAGRTRAATENLASAMYFDVEAAKEDKKRHEALQRLAQLRRGRVGTAPLPPPTAPDVQPMPGDTPLSPPAQVPATPDDALPPPEEPDQPAQPPAPAADRRTLENRIKEAEKKARALDRLAKDDERRAKSWREAADRAERAGDKAKAAEHRKTAEGFAADAADERRRAQEARREAAALRLQLADLRAGRTTPIASGNRAPRGSGPKPEEPPLARNEPGDREAPRLEPGGTPDIRPQPTLPCTLRRNRGYQGETFTTSILEALGAGASLVIMPDEGVEILHQSNSTGRQLDVVIGIDRNATPGTRTTVCRSPNGATAATPNGFTVEPAPVTPPTGPAPPGPGMPAPPGPGMPTADCLREGAWNFTFTVESHANNHNHEECVKFLRRMLKAIFGNFAGDLFSAKFEDLLPEMQCTKIPGCSGSCQGTLPRFAGKDNVQFEIQDLRRNGARITGKLIVTSGGEILFSLQFSGTPAVSA